MQNQLTDSFIIDTNAVISFITDRSPEQQKSVSELITFVEKNNGKIYITVEILEEFVYVTEKIYNVPIEIIKDRINKLLSITSINIISQHDFSFVFELWGIHIPDYVDSVLASVAISNQNIPVLTFDKKFRTSLKKLNIPVLPQKI